MPEEDMLSVPYNREWTAAEFSCAVFPSRMEAGIWDLQHVGISFWSNFVLCGHVRHQLVGSRHHLCHRVIPLYLCDL